MIKDVFSEKRRSVSFFGKALDSDLILAFYLSFVLIHVRKWSLFVFFVKYLSQWGQCDLFKNLILLVGGRWWMNRPMNLFLVRNNSYTFWMIIPVDLCYYLHRPIVFFSKNIFAWRECDEYRILRLISYGVFLLAM